MSQNVINLSMKPCFNVHGLAQLVTKFAALHGTHIFQYLCSHPISLPVSAICCIRIFRTTLEVQILLLQVLNKIANGALHGTVHKFHPGVLYFPRVIRFHSTHVNVISFMLITKLWPSLNQFSRNSQILNSIKARSLIQNCIQIRQYS